MRTRHEASTTTTSRAKIYLTTMLILLMWGVSAFPASAHCDSFDGPTLKDAMKALETNNVSLVLKWIDKDQEKEIIKLFNKTYSLRTGDSEVYAIVEKLFFETLVRLHRETEGAPYTGLKPAGATKPIVQLSDLALENKNIDDLIGKLNDHVSSFIRSKYNEVAILEPSKDDSPEEGRAYVKAYVEYTHSLEAIHDILEGVGGHEHAEISN